MSFEEERRSSRYAERPRPGQQLSYDRQADASKQQQRHYREERNSRAEDPQHCNNKNPNHNYENTKW